MQRKNNILKPSNRGGFAMILAVIVMVLVAGIMTLALTLTTETTKRTSDVYLYEQAQLLAKSAVELTLLDIAKNRCVDSFEPSFDDDIDSMFDVNVKVGYVYSSGVLEDCSSRFAEVTSSVQAGSVLMDITVQTKDGVATEPIRFFRRVMQKL